MASQNHTQYVLAERPKEHVLATTFRKETVPTPQPGEKQVLVKVNYLSMEPAMRGWLNDRRSYIPPVQIGEVMRAGGLGTVVAAGPNSKFKTGDIVTGLLGWTEFALLDDKGLSTIDVPPRAELLDFLGILGTTGLTAYFGLLDVGQIKPGETLVVSGAAGAVGSIVCQIGKIKGAKVVGIAGGDDKCTWLKNEIGIDVALNYKSETFHEEFKKDVGYFDVYFDNVGGEILNFLLTRMNKKARIALCGAISDYNKPVPDGLTSYLNLISMSAKMEGFIVLNYKDQWPAGVAELANWIADGKLKRRFTIVHGLEKAYDAMNMLFTGGNTGKLIVQVAQHEQSRL
ncbi:alcohol dehydrogenase [Fomitiporia mediterranea MF3/22]|uniref:alcohol dehydrogenase n=1 Tax=Fomitiporia mediterranea (strain MF3/22) TaxID=694068 RepID=UPI0004409870|nr:alcohol dehydrogenase [Fomitiporia mediterranea MF3/22]EJD06584.1 alcohol dehydrogenase [Fomitiporia mediterranea MF3/22]